MMGPEPFLHVPQRAHHGIVDRPCRTQNLSAMPSYIYTTDEQAMERFDKASTAAARIIETMRAAFIRCWGRVAVQGVQGQQSLAVNVCCHAWLRGRAAFYVDLYRLHQFLGTQGRSCPGSWAARSTTLVGQPPRSHGIGRPCLRRCWVCER
jgi:hypothetical protein